MLIHQEVLELPFIKADRGLWKTIEEDMEEKSRERNIGDTGGLLSGGIQIEHLQAYPCRYTQYNRKDTTTLGDES